MLKNEKNVVLQFVASLSKVNQVIKFADQTEQTQLQGVLFQELHFVSLKIQNHQQVETSLRVKEKDLLALSIGNKFQFEIQTNTNKLPKLYLNQI